MIVPGPNHLWLICKVQADMTTMSPKFFYWPSFIAVFLVTGSQTCHWLEEKTLLLVQLLLLSSTSAAVHAGPWMLKVQAAEVQRVKGTTAAAKCVVITNCTAAVISTAANTTVASASAADALGSECPKVIL